MNANKILQQLMQQASGSQKGSGVDVKGMLGGLSKQLGGSSSDGKSSGGSAGGFDMKSLLGGGAMGMLVGSKRGRKLGGKALKYGAIAGVGVLAWKAWQSSQNKSSGSEPQDAGEGERVEVLDGEYQERRSLELLQAMIMAARADGHIDEQEQAMITEQIDALGADDEMHRWVEQQLNAPLDAKALAREADSPQAAREMSGPAPPAFFRDWPTWSPLASCVVGSNAAAPTSVAGSRRCAIRVWARSSPLSTASPAATGRSPPWRRRWAARARYSPNASAARWACHRSAMSPSFACVWPRSGSPRSNYRSSRSPGAWAMALRPHSVVLSSGRPGRRRVRCVYREAIHSVNGSCQASAAFFTPWASFANLQRTKAAISLG